MKLIKKLTLPWYKAFLENSVAVQEILCNSTKMLIINATKNHLNWVTLISHIWNVPGSNLSQGSNYHY